MSLLAASALPQQLSDVMLHPIEFLEFAVHVPLQCMAETIILLDCALLVLLVLGFGLGLRFGLGSA